MSAVFGSRLARRALRRLPAQRAQQRLGGVRGLAEYSGPWPGPNPLKDIFIGLSIGLAFGVVWKSWQIRDKAERVRFYQEYERANRVEEALAAKRRADKEKEEGEQPEGEGAEETEEEVVAKAEGADVIPEVETHGQAA